ncbi:HAMP domain-containing histidine kinase [Subdoligranulum sp. DSM 109015]|uniref:histidine kinase n=1 Tax=Gemmiger gallinarum TaxID=2779354 RepID=A0ABR9R3U9_9FIRM|nr:HAMP domain-containing sensor histidine kinase [Gemmiger gallinarum]MBE5037826.1 HAMP domain-containing histidine kinase [Gemmiger gallinarum]
MLRNREILLFAAFCLGVGVLGVIVGFVLSPAAGVLALLLWAVLCAGYGVFTRWRYRQIAALSAYLSGVYGGGRALDIRDNTEGELSVLKNDLYKITITLQEQADQLARDKGFLADALGDISHQLKTPLTSALVMTDLLADPTLPGDRRKDFLDRLTRQLERIRWLVGALLKMSRLDAGAVTLQKAPVELSDLIRKALEPLGIAMELQGVRCDVTCPADARWVGDEAWTVQALQNILKNCVEQMPKGGVLRVRAERDPLACRITVEDTGGGIAPDDLPHLFERFYRGKSAGPESAGIGLALAQAIVTEQGGRITAENHGPGARFTLTLPNAVV